MTIWQDGVPFDRDQYNAMTEEERRKRVEAEKQMSDEEFIKNDNGGEYFEESGEHKPLTDAQIDDAVKTATDVQNQKVDDAMAVADETQKAQKVRQQAPAQGGGQRGQSVFDIPNSFGTMLADDPKYHEEARAARERREERRDAMREARMAAAQRRQELLESGRYFDDGRGNLRLKKQFRQVAKRRGRGFYNETLPDDGSGNAAVRAAGREAFDDAMEPDLWAQAAAAQRDKKVAASRQYTQNMVAANKADMEAMEKAKSDRKVNDAKGNLSVFDGIAAAFSDMDRKFKRQGEGDITEEEVVVEQPAEKFKRDALGRVTTQMNEPTKKKTGRRFVDGFVAPERIEAINSRLAGLGNNRVRITGIMARQKLGVDTKTKDGDPQFVVSGVKYDKSTGTNVPFQWVRSLQDVYRFGLENGIATGLDAASAENNVIHAISDVFGNLARRNAPSEKLRIAQANNETKEKVAQIQAQGRADAARVSAELKRMGYDIDVAKLEESRRHNQAIEKNAADRNMGRGAPRVDANRLKAMGEWLKANGPKTYDPMTGEEIGDNPNFDEKTWNERRKMYEDMLWAQDGSGAAQPAQGQGQVSQADAAAELARRKAARSAQAQGGAAASSSVNDLAQPVAALDGRTLAQSSEPQEKPQAQSSGILSADDERFLDETLRELEAPEEPEVVFPEDNPDYERRRRNGEAAREREAQKRAAEELPDWVKNLSAEDQARYKAAQTAARGIEALTKEMGKTQGAASTSTADSYAAMLDALGPNGSLRQKLSRLLSIIDKVGGRMSTSDF